MLSVMSNNTSRADVSALSLASLRTQAKQQLAKFAELAYAEIARTGISIPPAIEFITAEHGLMETDGRHPDIDLIDTVLCGNVQLTQYYKETEVLFEAVRAIENALDGQNSDARFHLGLTSAGALTYFG